MAGQDETRPGEVGVVLSDTEGTRWALDYAVRRARRQDGRVVLLRRPRPSTSPEVARLARRRAGAALRHLRELAPDLRVRVASPGALGPGVGMVVLGAGTAARGSSRVTSEVTALMTWRPRCPVLLLRAPYPTTTTTTNERSVLALVDPGPGAGALVEGAFDAARARSARLTLLHVFWDAAGSLGRVDARAHPDGRGGWARREQLCALVARIGAAHPGVRHRVVVTRGLLEPRLAQEAGHDVVVLGRGHQPLPVSTVLRQTGADLVVVPTLGADAVARVTRPDPSSADDVGYG